MQKLTKACRLQQLPQMYFLLEQKYFVFT